MAQVYAFTDQNGETRLFAEIHPDPTGTPFNGGTITGALTIDGTGTSTNPLLTVTDGAGDDAFTISATRDQVIAASLTVGGFYPQDTPLFVGGAVAQASDLVTVQDENGNNIVRILKAGPFGIANHAAPADGDVTAGECYLWFDQTNGAAKLMVKAKQADGAVKTAAIALS